MTTRISPERNVSGVEGLIRVTHFFKLKYYYRVYRDNYYIL